MGPWRIEGARPPLTVTIALMATRQATALITVRGLSAQVRLKHESVRTQASKLLGARELLIGDPDFDVEFFVGGDPFAAQALFDARSRALALKVFGPRPSAAQELFGGDDDPGIGLAGGALNARFVDTRYPHPPLTAAEMLGHALELAERLADRQLEQRLADTVRTDPVARVRLGALVALRDERPRDPRTRTALEAACGDEDSHVRLAAAIALGADGRNTLVEIASRVRGPDDVSARAVAELRSHLPVDQARAILAEALRTRRLETAAACVDRLGRSGSPEDVPLLRENESDPSRSDELHRACRSAIAAIHTRQPGASPGQLSLAIEQTGQVSIAEDEAGRLSIDGRDDES
jgi:hypothetical protein